MGFTERFTLSDGISVVEFRMPTDPKWLCPGGTAAAQIHQIKTSASFSLEGIDDLFEEFDEEKQFGVMTGDNFPVFIANLAGAKLRSRSTGLPRAAFIETAVRLHYCSNEGVAFGDSVTDFVLNHPPEQHREEVLDTLEQLALYAIYGLTCEPPDLQRLEHHMPILDQ